MDLNGKETVFNASLLSTTFSSMATNEEEISPGSVNKCLTFHPFSRLPIELRLKIWKRSLPGPRVIEVGWNYYAKKWVAITRSRAAASGLLGANHEAREVFLGKYSPILRYEDLGIDDELNLGPNYDYYPTTDEEYWYWKWSVHSDTDSYSMKELSDEEKAAVDNPQRLEGQRRRSTLCYFNFDIDTIYLSGPSNKYGVGVSLESLPQLIVAVRKLRFLAIDWSHYTWCLVGYINRGEMTLRDYKAAWRERGFEKFPALEAMIIICNDSKLPLFKGRPQGHSGEICIVPSDTDQKSGWEYSQIVMIHQEYSSTTTVNGQTRPIPLSHARVFRGGLEMVDGFVSSLYTASAEDQIYRFGKVLDTIDANGNVVPGPREFPNGMTARLQVER